MTLGVYAHVLQGSDAELAVAIDSALAATTTRSRTLLLGLVASLGSGVRL